MWDSKKKIFTIFFIGFILLCTAGLYILRSNSISEPSVTTGVGTPTPEPVATSLTICPKESEDNCDYQGSDGIQQAIVAAKGDTVIIIRKGSYEQVAVKIGTEGVAAKQNITIKGEGAETVLNGNQNDHIFTIADDSKIIVTDLTISNAGGDGINVSGNANVTVQQSTFIKNNYSALAFLGNSTGIINSSKISESKTYGGITAGQNAHVFIIGNMIRANRTFGVEAQGEAVIDVFSNIMYKNGGSGIGFFNSASGTVRNNTLLDNNDHGITINDSATVNVINNISVYNESQGIVGVSKELFVSMRYNLAYANKKGNWNNDFSEWPLVSNFSLNPLLVNKESDDYHLQSNSPAKNAGDPTILDVDGSVSDIGAYGGPDACKLDVALSGCL